jgi:6-phosphogluconolactonase/glucosamine-6-phosphate isomerase/deaminase
MGLKIVTNPQEAELASQAGQKLNELFAQHANTPLLFLTSSGSALPLLDFISPDVLNENITFSVLDERYSTDPTINNFSQVMTTHFYATAMQKKCKYIETTITPEDTLEESADEFESSLKTWREKYPDGIIIATQGMGPDGHTSGIMPFPENEERFNELFLNPNKWVVGYDATGKNQYPLRITTTIPFLKMVDYSVMYVTGENKKNPLQKVIEKVAALHEIPAAVINYMHDVYLFTSLKTI